MRDIKIAGFTVNRGSRPFLIAEAGINHNGDLPAACAMIEAAKQAGADAIKFQTFKAEEFITDPTLTYTYRSQGVEVTESMLEMFKRYEFSREQWRIVKEKCDQAGIVFFSTPQNRPDLELLLELGVPAIKVGSDDFTNLPLIRSYAETGLPLLLACGMSTLAEVYQSLEAAGALEGYPTILLLCTSQYPTPPEDVNLLKLKTLSAAFPMVPLGFSDHTRGVLAASLAVGLGAVVFEKHFTLDHLLPGPDHWFSEDPAGLTDWVASVRTASVMMGDPVVRPTPAEKQMRSIARRSVVAVEEIGKGELFTEGNTGLRRPGTGLPPALLAQILGARATRTIQKKSLIRWGDFA